MFELMTNSDVSYWKAWFDIHGFTEERADMRMMLQCAAAAGVKDAMTWVSDFMKARQVESKEQTDDEKIMAMFKAMG